MDIHMTETKNNVKKPVFLFAVLLICVLAVAGGMMVSQMMRADARTLSGEKVHWSGENWKVINFFAPWCAPCLREIPALNTLHYSLGETVSLGVTVKFYGVSFDGGSQQELQQLVGELNVEFPVLDTSTDTTLPMKYPDYLPATYLISPDGKVADALYGEQTEASLRTRLSELAARGDN